MTIDELVREAEGLPPVPPGAAAATEERWRAARERYLAALLAGDAREAQALAIEVRGPADLEGFLLGVVQPAMREIGWRSSPRRPTSSTSSGPGCSPTWRWCGGSGRPSSHSR